MNSRSDDDLFNGDTTDFNFLREYPFLDFDDFTSGLMPSYVDLSLPDETPASTDIWQQTGVQASLPSSPATLLPPLAASAEFNFSHFSLSDFDGADRADSLFSSFQPEESDAFLFQSDLAPQEEGLTYQGDVQADSLTPAFNPIASPVQVQPGQQLPSSMYAETRVLPESPMASMQSLRSETGNVALDDDAGAMASEKTKEPQRRKSRHDRSKLTVNVDGKRITIDAFCKRAYIFADTGDPVSRAELKTASFQTDGSVLVNGRGIEWRRRLPAMKKNDVSSKPLPYGTITKKRSSSASFSKRPKHTHEVEMAPNIPSETMESPDQPQNGIETSRHYQRNGLTLFSSSSPMQNPASPANVSQDCSPRMLNKSWPGQ